MAYASPTGAVSFNITANTNQLDLSNELAELIRTDNTVFLSRLGESIKATQTRHYWNEDKLITNLATDADAGGLAPPAAGAPQSDARAMDSSGVAYLVLSAGW